MSFCHRLPFDRSSLTHWRRRLGEGELAALIQESLAVAHKSRALASRDLERMVVDTTVQPKAIAHPTDAQLCHQALEKLVDLARGAPPRCAATAELSPAGQAGIDHGRTLQPRASIQAGAARTQIPAHPAG